MASHTPNGTYSDLGNTYQPCPTSPTPPPVPTKTRPSMVKQTSPAVARKQVHYYEATPGSAASLPRTTARRKIPQPAPRSPQHHRSSREPTGYLRPVSTIDSVVHVAPMVPERPRLRSASAVPSRMKKKEEFLSDGMLLPDFVKKYSKSFPVHIKVLKGYCGPSSRLTISTSDTYNIHFMKHTKVVAIKDAHDTPYSVPLNSAMEFGLVYDPNDNRSEAINGLTFEKISEIVAMHTPPKVFCALKAFQGEDEKSSMYDNEVLIVKQVLKPRFKGKRALKVYSLLTQSEKLLHEDCFSRFTTDPYMVRMHLLEMIEHVNQPFPHQAIVFFSPDIYQNPDTAAQVQELPDTILSKVITMCHCITETSLIASSLLADERQQYSDSDSDSEIDNLFDIPIDENLAGIEIAVMETNNAEETEKLYDDTRSIVESFNPSKVRSCKDTGSEHTFTAQSLFYSAVRPGCEKIGVQIDTPSTIYDHIIPRPFPSKTSPPSKQHQQQLQEAIQQQNVKQSVQHHIPQQQHAPQQHVPPKHVPQQHVPPKHVPQHAPLPHVPKQQVTQQHMPQEHVSQQQKRLTQQQVPQPHVPQPHVPQQHVPHQHVPQLTDQSQATTAAEDENYDTIDCNDEVFDGDYDDVEATIEKHNKQSRAEETAKAAKFSTLQSCTEGLKTRTTSLESESKKQMQELQAVKSSVDQLSKQFKALDAKCERLAASQLVSHSRQLPHPVHMNGEENKGGSSSQKANMETLRSVNSMQVQNLLEAMDLAQYKETFAREHITGEILTELDGDILLHELGVSSKIHRIRLMKVITGHHSVQQILSGADPYVSFGSQ